MRKTSKERRNLNSQNYNHPADLLSEKKPSDKRNAKEMCIRSTSILLPALCRASLLSLFLLFVLFSSGCTMRSGQNSFTVQPLLDNGYHLETVDVVLPNCQREYHLLFLSDLHLLVLNDEIADDQVDMVRERLEEWAGEAPLLWEKLPALLNECHADMLLFGGDMIDLCSTASFDLLKEGLLQLNTEYMYVRADHDTGAHWQKDQDRQKRIAMHDSLCENTGAMYHEFPDFVLLGINNSTSQLTEDGLRIAQEAFALKKPIIILTHVPLCSDADSSLQENSRARWGDRALVWGSGTTYIPDQTTQKLMDLIYAENSPVVEILCGHLHFSWDGMITERIAEHVFSPAYEKNLGVITISGKKPSDQ